MKPDELAELLREHGYHVSAFGDSTDIAGAAAVLYMSRRTLEELNDEGRGPPRFRVSERWKYPLDELLLYRDRNMVREAGAQSAQSTQEQRNVRKAPLPAAEVRRQDVHRKTQRSKDG